MPATKRKSTRPTSTGKPRTQGGKKAKVEKVMHEFKVGELKSGRGGKGGKVKSRKQAIAIALSESGQTRRTPHAGSHS